MFPTLRRHEPLRGEEMNASSCTVMRLQGADRKKENSSYMKQIMLSHRVVAVEPECRLVL